MSSHLQRQHLHHLAQLETTGELPNPDAGDGIILSLHECNDQGIMDDTGEEIPLRGEEIPLRSSISCSHIMAKKSAALLLLTLKERHRLTQTAVNFSIGQIKQMLQYVFDDVKVSVSRKLNIDEVDIEDCFDIDLFEGLETKYLQTKFCNDHFNLVDPITIKLGTEFIPVQNRNKRRLQEKTYTFQYVPLLDGLKSLLTKQEILDEGLKLEEENLVVSQLVTDVLIVFCLPPLCEPALIATHQ